MKNVNYVDCSRFNGGCGCSDDRNKGCYCAPNITVNVSGSHGPAVPAYINAQNTGGTELAVATTGTLVPLPNNQVLENFTVNAGNTTFTAEEAGVYLLTYTVNTVQQEDFISRILLNGAELADTVYDPATTDDRYNVTTLVTLVQGDTISLQLYDVTDTITLQNGVGASLTLVKIA